MIGESSESFFLCSSFLGFGLQINRLPVQPMYLLISLIVFFRSSCIISDGVLDMEIPLAAPFIMDGR